MGEVLSTHKYIYVYVCICPYILIYTGISYDKLGQTDLAIADFTRVLELDCSGGPGGGNTPPPPPPAAGGGSAAGGEGSGQLQGETVPGPGSVSDLPGSGTAGTSPGYTPVYNSTLGSPQLTSPSLAGRNHPRPAAIAPGSNAWTQSAPAITAAAVGAETGSEFGSSGRWVNRGDPNGTADDGSSSNGTIAAAATVPRMAPVGSQAKRRVPPPPPIRPTNN